MNIADFEYHVMSTMIGGLKLVLGGTSVRIAYDAVNVVVSVTLRICRSLSFNTSFLGSRNGIKHDCPVVGRTVFRTMESVRNFVSMG